MTIPDPVQLTADLIRCPSVTPEEGGALMLLHDLLSAHGFACTWIDRGGIRNLHARFGTQGPVFGFNGHTDVVPPGEGWSADPFSAQINNGVLIGRGAQDMKSGVAAFVVAALRVAQDNPSGSIAITVTGDEEGDALHGTRAILDWMRESGESMDVCLVGEPTCPNRMGEMIKIGRRGSMTAWLTASGVQGHSAYPHRAVNPIPPLAALVAELAAWQLDEGTAHFDASTLAVTGFDVGNSANNVIPGEARAMVNIRFNDAHSSASLIKELEARMEAAFAAGDASCTMKVKVSGESFLTPPGPFSDLIAQVVEDKTGLRPVLSTSGGTSDARFVKELCPVVEFGLVGDMMHKADERVEVTQIQALTDIYEGVIRGWFET